jgi:septin family protein
METELERSKDFFVQNLEPTRLIKLNIAVVGNDNSGKTAFIKQWLSINPNTIITSNVYSKIIFIGSDSVQIGIHEISPNDNLMNTLRRDKFDSVIYCFDCQYGGIDSIPVWYQYMKNYTKVWTHQIIFGHNNDGQPICEIENELKSFCEENQLQLTLKNIYSEDFLEFIEKVTLDVYQLVIKNIDDSIGIAPELRIKVELIKRHSNRDCCIIL